MLTAAQLFSKFPRALRRHRLMKGWMRLTGEDPLQLVRIRDDAFGYADLSDCFLRLIVIDGSLDEDFFRVADALLQAGGEFLDVGANHGLLSFGLARKLGASVRFHLFEPNAKLQASIAKSRELYPFMRARTHCVAVSDQDGMVLFNFDENQTGASHIVRSNGIPVPSIKLDTYIKQERLDRIDLLKLDIEGYELAALLGAKDALVARVIRAIYFEYFEKWLVRVGPPSALIEFLDSVAYEVCFVRRYDLKGAVPTLTLKADGPGHGLPLSSVRGRTVPAMTDLLAVPRENLTSI